MRILALMLTALAVSVWWHPLSVPVQSLTLLAVAGACMAYRSADRRAEAAAMRLAELEDIARPLRPVTEAGEAQDVR